MKKWILIILLFTTKAWSQDTIRFSELTKKFPTDLNQKMTYYHNDKKYTGYAIKYFPGGELKEISQYINGLIHGEYKRFYKNGQITELTNYSFGSRNGESILWYMEGQKMSSMNYMNGTPTDTTKTWHLNGQLKSVGIEDIESGTVSYYSTYFEDGQKNFELRTTHQKSWYKNGTLKSSAVIKNGKPEGKHKFYNLDGKVSIIEYWENGKIVKTKVKKK
jgi:antitoxin component YwqK of YwqJK toxin-antitoxin module